MNLKSATIPGLLLAALLSTGCSINKLAANKVGDALAASGTTFSSDDDPELIKAAVPFSLKLMEAILSETPDHTELLRATAAGFTQYGYAFVQLPATEVRETDLARSRAMTARAKKLFLRARDYGLRGLETRKKRFRQELETDPAKAVGGLKKQDVALLYWTAASWVAAISADKTDAYLISDLPKVEAMLNKAVELNEAFDDGAIPSLMITFETVRQGVSGDPYERARAQFKKAVALSGGHLAGPYVGLAEAVCIPTEAREEYLRLLNQALAIDPDKVIEYRLVNVIMQERARWLIDHVDDYFLPPLDEN